MAAMVYGRGAAVQRELTLAAYLYMTGCDGVGMRAIVPRCRGAHGIVPTGHGPILGLQPIYPNPKKPIGTIYRCLGRR